MIHYLHQPQIFLAPLIKISQPVAVLGERVPHGRGLPDPAVVQDQFPVLQQKKRFGRSLIQDGGIVRQVVAGAKGQQDDIRGIFPHPVAQDQQFPAGAEPRLTEIDHLDPASPQLPAALEFLLHDRPEGLFPVHIQGFGIGVAQDRDPQRIRRLCQDMLPVPEAVAVDAHIAAALLEPVAPGTGTQPGAEHRVELIKLGIFNAEQAQAALHHQGGKNQPRDHQQDFSRPSAQD
jgi:hypothetical protein